MRRAGSVFVSSSDEEFGERASRDSQKVTAYRSRRSGALYTPLQFRWLLENKLIEMLLKMAGVLKRPPNFYGIFVY